eukprot:10005109-Alexandrium_andersonii.AAC.1
MQELRGVPYDLDSLPGSHEYFASFGELTSGGDGSTWEACSLPFTGRFSSMLRSFSTESFNRAGYTSL